MEINWKRELKKEISARLDIMIDSIEIERSQHPEYVPDVDSNLLKELSSLFWSTKKIISVDPSLMSEVRDILRELSLYEDEMGYPDRKLWRQIKEALIQQSMVRIKSEQEIRETHIWSSSGRPQKKWWFVHKGLKYDADWWD